MWHWFKLWVAGYSRYSRCWMGFHRWSMPGGCCEKCGLCDDIWEGHERCGKTCKWFVPPDADTLDIQTGQGRR